jgi:hypothetical protein
VRDLLKATSFCKKGHAVASAVFCAGTEKGTAMGEVIQFPEEGSYSRGGRYIDSGSEPATVIILPVVRIDRGPDGTNGSEPDAGNSAGRKRRRRIAR